MASFDETIQRACDELEIPGAVLAASSADGMFLDLCLSHSKSTMFKKTNINQGKFTYQKAFGVRSLNNPSPMKLDATMWLASCTKLMTTVAALQCVERGQFGLDDDVTPILYELKGRNILSRFEEGSGKPILIPNTNAMTLR